MSKVTWDGNPAIDINEFVFFSKIYKILVNVIENENVFIIHLNIVINMTRTKYTTQLEYTNCFMWYFVNIKLLSGR